jgi:hypothetical protein
MPAGVAAKGVGKRKEESSFLKKRSKKLLRIRLRPFRMGSTRMRKSFLVLFFKKDLPSFPPAAPNPICRRHE